MPPAAAFAAAKPSREGATTVEAAARCRKARRFIWPLGDRMCKQIRAGRCIGSVALEHWRRSGLKQIVGRLGRQSEVERRALALDAGGPDASAMLIDDAAADGKPKARAAHRARVRRIALLEPIEDVLEL